MARLELPSDAARAMLVYEQMDGIGMGLERIESDIKEKMVLLVRIKDRFASPVGGWSDFLLNLRFPPETPGVTMLPFEIQLVHKKMLVLRHDLGGHDIYERFRFAQDVLAREQSMQIRETLVWTPSAVSGTI